MKKIKFKALGTNCFIGIDSKNKKKILKKVKKLIDDLEEKLSVFKKGSDIYKLNENSGEFIRISEESFQLILKSIYYSKKTKGFFDITIRPLVKIWSIGKRDFKIPKEEEINKNKELINYKNISFIKEKLEVRIGKNQEIDLGAIAKGYIADLVKEFLIENNVKKALINLGGNVVLLGEKELGVNWAVGVRNPLKGREDYLAILKLKDKSIVTSASYERFSQKDGKIYSHIINPKTGQPVESELLAVTIVSDKSIDGDGLSTALYILGIEESLKLLNELNIDGILITKDKNIIITEGLVDKFQLIDKKFNLYKF
ncbi:MAG: FAD:protein FMN transferase [Sarcina sp.]